VDYHLIMISLQLDQTAL